MVMEQTPSATPTVFIVDDEHSTADFISQACELQGWPSEHFASAEAFMATDFRNRQGCMVLDLRLPGLSGLEFQVWLRGALPAMPVILISGFADVATAVTGMRNGALTLLQKPFGQPQITMAIKEAMSIIALRAEASAIQARYAQLVAALTRSEIETAELIVSGRSNKQIAATQGLSLRGIEDRRSRLMKHFGTRSLAEFVSVVKAALTST
jgi:FixJ family two-component response regulator